MLMVITTDEGPWAEIVLTQQKESDDENMADTQQHVPGQLMGKDRTLHANISHIYILHHYNCYEST